MKFSSLDNSLTDWEKLQYFSRPHDTFRLDWSSYNSKEFGETFLPYVDQIASSGIKIYDGAAIFKGVDQQDNNTLKLENDVFRLTVYTYPEASIIDENILRLSLSSDEVCTFLRLDDKGNIQVKFVWGYKFSQFLSAYYKKTGKGVDVAGLAKKTFATDKKSLEAYFGKSANHQITLLYILSYLDIEIGTESNDDGVKIKRLKTQNTVVPFGVKSYSKDPKDALKKEPENEKVRFEIKILEKGIEDITIEVMNGKDVYNEYLSGLQNANGTPIIKPKTYSPGTYYFEWDGFDKNQIYDSKILVDGKFKLRIITKANKVLTTIESEEFDFKYTEAKWIDIKIDKKAKRVDLILRVDLKEGDEIGTQVDCDDSGTNCPWDKIPAVAITNEGIPPIKTRTQSYVDLQDAALRGIDLFWGRNTGNYGQNVSVNGVEYEVYVKSELSEEGLKAPKINYVTNGNELRSRNFFLSRILFYNVGYIYDRFWESYVNYQHIPEAKRRYDNKGWYYKPEDIADFEMTAAHEIGHEILLAYGGLDYSYSHKDTSTVLTQKSFNTPLPNAPDEVDLMKYYYPYYDINRTVASREDVLGFFWLTKLKVK